MLQFIQSMGATILKQNHATKYAPVKFLTLAMSIILELERTKERAHENGTKSRTLDLSFIEGIYEKFVDKFLLILVSFVIGRSKFFLHGLWFFCY